MRRLFFLLAAPVILLAACNKDDINSDMDIIFDASCNMAPEVSADGGEVYFNFTSNHDWSIETFDEWISVMPEVGTTEDKCFTLTVGRHEEGEVRTSRIIMHLANGKSVEIPIIQQMRDKFHAPTTEVYSVDAMGGDIEIQIDTNLEYSISLPKGIEWLSLADTRAMRTDKLCFTAQPNTTNQSRVANIALYDVRYERPLLHEFCIVQTTEGLAINEISYTTTNNEPIDAESFEGYGPMHILHYWEAGVGRIIFNDAVSTIPNNAFSNQSTLQSITLPSEISEIGSWAFAGCSNIEHFTIPAKVTHIGNCAFDNCGGELTAMNKLQNVSYPTTNDGHWLHGSHFTKATLNDKVGNNSFAEYTALEDVVIMPGVKSIGSSAFVGCSNLASVEANSLKEWCEINFDNAGSNPLAMGGVDLIIGSNKVTSINTTDNNITAIGKYAFVGYMSLEFVTLGDGIKSIGRSAFEGCSIENMELGHDIASVGNYAFNGCFIDRLAVGFDIPDFNLDCTSTSHWFYDLSLRELVITDGVKSIGNYAFNKLQGVESITLGDSVEYVGKGAFANLSTLVDLTLGEGIKSLDEHAFYACSALSEVVLPEGIEAIGDYAFDSCSQLAHIDIPSGVTTIGEYAFDNCDSLTNVACYPTTPPTLGNIYAFGQKCHISVAATAYNSYIEADNWKRIADRIIGDL